MSLLKHAEMEFRAAGWVDEKGSWKDAAQKQICKDVTDLLKLFAEQGHSGTTGSYAISLFNTLAKYEPVVPLTGEDWEWLEVSDGVFQNKRCSRVFKQADRFNGQAYDINGVVFWEWCTGDDGEKYRAHFTSSKSFTPVVFPYIPTTIYEESNGRTQTPASQENT